MVIKMNNKSSNKKVNIMTNLSETEKKENSESKINVRAAGFR